MAAMDRDMIVFAWCVYGIVALVFLIETFAEGEKAEAPWDGWRIGGLLLSLVWPVYAVAVLGTVVFSRRKTTRTIG